MQLDKSLGSGDLPQTSLTFFPYYDWMQLQDMLMRFRRDGLAADEYFNSVSALLRSARYVHYKALWNRCEASKVPNSNPIHLIQPLVQCQAEVSLLFGGSGSRHIFRSKSKAGSDTQWQMNGLKSRYEVLMWVQTAGYIPCTRLFSVKIVNSEIYAFGRDVLSWIHFQSIWEMASHSDWMVVCSPRYFSLRGVQSVKIMKVFPYLDVSTFGIERFAAMMSIGILANGSFAFFFLQISIFSTIHNTALKGAFTARVRNLCYHDPVYMTRNVVL